MSPQATFQTAQRLRATDPNKAEHLYRTVVETSGYAGPRSTAEGRRGESIDDRNRWAALALYDLAEMHASSHPDLALRELDELARRFPTAANLEDAAWLRIETLRREHRADDARRAAGEYLAHYPSGTYVEQARQVATP